MNKSIILSCYYVILIHQALCKVNFVLHHLDLCNNTQGEFRLIGNASTSNNVFFVHFQWDVKLPLNDRIGITALVESKVTKTLYIEVFTIREKNFCKAVHTYLGEFWFTIERKLGLPVGVCPIPARKYVIDQLAIEFKKLKLQTFPYGTLRITWNVEDNNNRARLLTCVVLEIENLRRRQKQNK